MPYAKKSKKVSRSRNSRSKRSYRARFQDDKINTAIERKIKQIAVEEDSKSRNLLVRAWPYGSSRTSLLSCQYLFSSLPENEEANTPPDVSKGLEIQRLTEVGGSSLSGQGGAMIRPDNIAYKDSTGHNTYAGVYRFKKCQVFLQFVNEDPLYPCDVRVSIVHIPNANPYTANDAIDSGVTTVLMPTQYTCGVKDMRNKGIFKNGLLNYKDFSNVKHSVLASKQIRLQPTFSSAGGGADNKGNRWKDVNLTINWKGKGKKFVYNDTADTNNQSMMSDANMYLVIAHNQISTASSQPAVRGMAGVQYYIEGTSTIGVES